MTGPARDPADEDIAAVVSELEETLSALRAELADRDRREQRSPAVRPDDDSRDRRPRGDAPRPPAPGELFRFTADYTIPTVVAVLEATIETLELLQGVIDLAAPGESPDRRGRRGRRDRRRGSLGQSVLSDAVADGVSRTTDRAAADAADALERLRETLTEADLPSDEESRDLVADARELSAELERRVRESRETVDRERARERRDDRGDGTDRGPVTISVEDPDAESDRGPGGSSGAETAARSEDDAEDANDSDDADDADDAPEVDVDAELESIKRQMGRHDNAGDTDADGDDTTDTDDR